MAKKFEEFEIEGAANTLIEAKKIKKNSKLHTAAINLIKSKQKIATLVIQDK